MKRRKSMKKIMTAVTVFASCMLPLCALDNLHFGILGNVYAPGIDGYFGASGLKMSEMVFRDSSGGDLISNIEWDIGYQVSAGVGLSVGPADRFNRIGVSLGGMFLWFFPVNNRNMKDTDWDDSGNVYSYGESMVSTLSGMQAEGGIAVNFPIRHKYLLEITTDVWYSRYAAIAHDGWTGWAGSDKKTAFYGAAVEYIQEWIIAAPGIGLRRKFNKTHCGIKASVSPFIWGCHVDNHYFRTFENGDPDLKYMRFTDNTTKGIFFRIQGDWFWNITSRVQMGITLNYLAVNNSRGDTSVSSAGLAEYSFVEKGMAGAAVKTFGLDLSIRTTL